MYCSSLTDGFQKGAVAHDVSQTSHYELRSYNDHMHTYAYRTSIELQYNSLINPESCIARRMMNEMRTNYVIRYSSASVVPLPLTTWSKLLRSKPREQRPLQLCTAVVRYVRSAVDRSCLKVSTARATPQQMITRVVDANTSWRPNASGVTPVAMVRTYSFCTPIYKIWFWK